MGDTEELWVKLHWDDEGFPFKIEKAKSSLVAWRDQTNANSIEMAKWGSAISATVAPILAVGVAVYTTVQKYGEMADEINDLAYTTDLSTRKIQELKYAATIANTDFSTVKNGVNQLTLSIAGAGDKSSEAAKAFAALNVTTSGRSNDEILENTVAALVEMEDTTKRNALAATLLGRNWKEMLPYLQAYADNADEIKGVNYLSDEDLKDLEDAKSALDALGARLTIIGGQATAAGIDVTKRAMNGLDFVIATLANDQERLNRAWSDSQKLDRGEEFDPAAWAKSNGITGKSMVTLYKPEDWDRIQAEKKAGMQFEGMTAEEAGITYLRDITIPSLQIAYDDLKVSGKASAAEIGEAYIKLKTAQEELISLTEKDAEKMGLTGDQAREIVQVTNDLTDARKNLTNAKYGDDIKKYSAEVDTLTGRLDELKNKYKDYENAVKDVTAAQSDLSDLTSDYYEDTLAAEDPAEAMELRKNYLRSKRDKERDLTGAQLELSGADAEIAALTEKYDGSEITIEVKVDTSQAAADLQNIGMDAPSLPDPYISRIVAPDTGLPTKIPSLGGKSGDVIINLDGKELRRVKGVVNTSGSDQMVGLTAADLMQAGVRPS